MTATVAPDPVRFAEWLDHGVTPDLLGRMLAVPRLAAACRRVMDKRLGPLPASLEATAMVASHMDGLALLGLAQRAGAVWHARAVLRVIDGEAVRALVQVIGPAPRLVAIRHSALAPADPLPEADAVGDGPPAPARLGVLMAADGLCCLHAWCAAQCSALGERILLRLPPASVAVTAAHRLHGPAILDALLAELA